jgi:hypothetical protein
VLRDERQWRCGRRSVLELGNLHVPKAIFRRSRAAGTARHFFNGNSRGVQVNYPHGQPRRHPRILRQAGSARWWGKSDERGRPTVAARLERGATPRTWLGHG